jgi:hypothetical protein
MELNANAFLDSLESNARNNGVNLEIFQEMSGWEVSGSAIVCFQRTLISDVR